MQDLQKLCKNEMCKIGNFSLACFIDFYKTYKIEVAKSMNSMKYFYIVDYLSPKHCCIIQESFSSNYIFFQCPYEWFHYDCVGITAPPKGKWYCPKCQSNMARRKKDWSSHNNQVSRRNGHTMLLHWYLTLNNRVIYYMLCYISKYRNKFWFKLW